MRRERLREAEEPRVRTMFTLYLLLIATGIAVYVIVGATHQ